ncbi:hypothetical protein D3C71_1841270 [compost metagenome]
MAGLPHSRADVPGCAIPTGKEQQIHPGFAQGQGGGPGILGARLGPGGLVEDAVRQRQLGGQCLPHLPRHRQQLELLCERAQGQQGLTGPLPGLGHGAPRQRLGHHAVAALETDGPADAGDGVDDEP